MIGQLLIHHVKCDVVLIPAEIPRVSIVMLIKEVLVDEFLATSFCDSIIYLFCDIILAKS